MALFAQLDENKVVLTIIAVVDAELLDENGQPSEAKGIQFCVDLFGGSWLQTFDTGAKRKNLAKVGDTYDVLRDAFVSPKPKDTQYINHVFNEDTCRWDAKIIMPTQEPPNVLA